MKRLIDYIRMERGAEAVPAEAHVVIGDDVLAGIDNRPDKQWTAADFPCIAPPFAHTFIEARSLYAAQHLSDPGLYMGLHIADVTERMWKVNTALPGETRHPATRWILALFAWLRAHNRVFQYPGMCFIHVGEDGRWLDDANRLNLIFDYNATRGIDAPEALYAMGFCPPSDLTNNIPFALMTLSLMHCKNVSLREQLPPGAEARKFRKKHGMEMATFHTLTIRPTRASRLRGGQAGHHPEDLRAHHIRHGHFRTYTKEAPLFGKWVGRWFVEAHAVGSREAGTVDKRYRVQP